MAEVKGKDGSVTFSSGNTTVNSWVLNYVGGTYETTNFDNSSGGKAFIAGITEWSGSYDCFYSTGNVATAGTTGSITLKTTSSTSVGVWSGNIIITGMDVTTPVDGVVTQSYSFQGTGALS